ncbi:MAG: molecular chaperone TorD family protein [Candidatus Scalindua sediminis]|nr:molecular chaperone TorD family protein [Candidatus Scalindua sediminis]
MENKNIENVEDLLASSQVYQFLSTCLLEPKKETLALLCNKDYMDEVESCLRKNGNGELSETFRHLQEGLQNTDIETLTKGYRDTFGGATVAMDCPPYEMYFSGSHIWQQTQDLADISGFYKAYGIEVSKDETSSRWDHIAVELEFLHFLTYKLAYAIENHGDKEQESCLTGKKKFLNAHIGRWIQAFSSAVWKKSPEKFYRQAAKLANSFVHIEMAKLDVDVEEIDEHQGNEPDYMQRLEGKSAMGCDSCMDEEKYG